MESATALKKLNRSVDKSMTKTTPFSLVFFIFLLTSCTSNYGRVVSAYSDGNPAAKEILERGFISGMGEYVDEGILRAALEGNDECLDYLLREIDALSGRSFKDYSSPICKMDAPYRK
jgi:hypothetical protein